MVEILIKMLKIGVKPFRIRLTDNSKMPSYVIDDQERYLESLFSSPEFEYVELNVKAEAYLDIKNSYFDVKILSVDIDLDEENLDKYLQQLSVVDNHFMIEFEKTEMCVMTKNPHIYNVSINNCYKEMSFEQPSNLHMHHEL